MKRVNMTHNVVDLYARQARQKADGVAGGRGFVSARRRAAWFSSYITTILQRDVRDIANVEGLVTMPVLLSLLAARSAGLLNVSELSRSAGIKLTAESIPLSARDGVPPPSPAGVVRQCGQTAGEVAQGPLGR